MKQKKLACLLSVCALVTSAHVLHAQQLFTSNEALSAAEIMQPRNLNYWPEANDFVCINGTNRFTRALYGGYSAFRLETSDYPEFGLFMPYMGGNLLFDINAEEYPDGLYADMKGDKPQAQIECRYRPGKRIYKITLPEVLRHKKNAPALVTITAMALYDYEAAVWEIESENVKKGVTLSLRYGAANNASFSRNGDMGVDKKDCFDFALDKCRDNRYTISPHSFLLDYGSKSRKGQRYMDGYFSENVRLEEVKAQTARGETVPYIMAYFDLTARKKPVVQHCMLGLTASFENEQTQKEIAAGHDAFIAKVMQQAEAKVEEVAASLQIETPDPLFNALGGTISMATDGIWGSDGVWQHGAIGWRMPLPGWRAAYTGDVMGWHDKARIHFDNYAASQLVDVPIDPALPAKDSARNLARGLEKKGTPIYSTGYICRLPNSTSRVNHYDMNLVYIDELLWHFRWTGDWDYVYKLWPTLKRHLDWEKRNFDPDNDGLYDAYCCIWASDALYYSGGKVTHSSAYNHRANKMAAMIARHFANDPTIQAKGEAEQFSKDAERYQAEADLILKALNEQLWMPEQGVWAEYRDNLGLQRLHKAPALWTIYHALDSEVATPEQAYDATMYVDACIPHFPILVDTEQVGNRPLESMPEACRTMVDDIDQGGYATVSTTSWQPYAWSINNVAMAEVAHTALAYWQAGRNEQAFHLMKSALLDAMCLGKSPGNIGQISFYDAARSECYRDFGDPVGMTSRTIIQGLFGMRPDRLNNRVYVVPGLPADWKHASISTADYALAMKHEGNKSEWTYQPSETFRTDTLVLQVPARGLKLSSVSLNGRALTKANGTTQWLDGAYGQQLVEVKIVTKEGADNAAKQTANSRYACSYAIALEWEGEPRTAQAETKNYHIAETGNIVPQYFGAVKTDALETVDLSAHYNLDVKELFRQEYLSPRWPYATLALPTQGIGEWCHPLDSFHVNDMGLRQKAQAGNGVIQTSLGVRFQTPAQGPNVAFTSRWDNYPNQIAIPLEGKASHVYLMMTGTTNAMQCRIENGAVRVRYTDGSCDSLMLVNPSTWSPIDQDLMQGLPSFYLQKQGDEDMRPFYRMHLQTAEVYQPKPVKLNVKTKGGAATLIDLPVDYNKTLQSIEIETLSNDVIIGLMGLTLQR